MSDKPPLREFNEQLDKHFRKITLQNGRWTKEQGKEWIRKHGGKWNEEQNGGWRKRD